MTTQIQTQLAAQRDLLTSAETVLSEKVAIEHSAGKHSWWSPNDAMTISASVLVFGLIVMVLASRALQKGIPAALVMRLFGMLTIVVMAVFLVVAGYDSQQIAPVTGLLGTLAGYLLGKSSGAETVGAGAVDGTKPKPKQASNAST